MREAYPLTWAYLELNRDRLEARDAGRSKGPSWYGFSRNQNLEAIWRPKIIVPYMNHQARAAGDPEGTFAIVNVTTGGYFVAPFDHALIGYLTAALNSRHAEIWWREHATPHAGGYFGLTARAIELLPVPDPADLTPAALATAAQPTGPDDDPFGRMLAEYLPG